MMDEAARLQGTTMAHETLLRDKRILNATFPSLWKGKSWLYWARTVARRFAILLPALLLCSCAEQIKQLDLTRAQNSQATPYGQSPGFSSIYGFVSKEQRQGLWTVIFRGNEFTSFQRAIAIAELRSAQQASANRFSYYRFKVTRKKVHCPQGQLQYTSDNDYQIAVEGEAETSTAFQPGMNDAKASAAKLLSGVQNDPTAEAKNDAYQAILDDCAGIASLGAEYF
jgi:hypothetical protein